VTDPARRRAPFWIGMLVGAAVIGYGLAGILRNSDSTLPPRLGGWVVGGALLHDLVLAPVVLATGWLVVRLVPATTRRAVIVGLVLSGMVLLVAWIPLRGYGDRPENPTLHPIDYGTSVLTALAIVWGVAVGVAVFDWRRQSRAPS
jgi:hypothetical protein